MFILGIKINILFERKIFIKYRSNREEKYICVNNRYWERERGRVDDFFKFLKFWLSFLK